MTLPRQHPRTKSHNMGTVTKALKEFGAPTAPTSIANSQGFAHHANSEFVDLSREYEQRGFV